MTARLAPASAMGCLGRNPGRSRELLVLASVALGLTGCVLGRPISFARDVHPIFEEHCLECHRPPRGKGYRKSGLSLVTYDSLMRGSRFGPVVHSGDSRHSILNMLVEGRVDASLRMPHREEEALSPGKIETLRLWVDQGARNN